MQEVPREIVDQFAVPFSKGRQGLSGKQLYAFFSLYSSLVKPIEVYHPIRPLKVDYFVECLYKLPPNLQYAALTDLCKEPPAAPALPNEAMRMRLLQRLHSHLGVNTVGITYSRLSQRIFRESWLTAHSRIANSPSAAITAARTLLETTLKTIIDERGAQTDNSGNLGRLLNQALTGCGNSG